MTETPESFENAALGARLFGVSDALDSDAWYTPAWTGNTHADIVAEAHRVATPYWGGRRLYDIDSIDADEGYRGGITAHVTTKAHGVAS